jgi:L-threonylcarbamoyladenylate synthase
MKVFELNPTDPEPGTISEVASLLKKGGVIAYPTDTLYGLGGDGFNPEAHHRIMILKGREGTKPFPYIIDRAERLREWRIKLSAIAGALAKSFWPGPVSLVVKGSGNLPGHTLNNDKTICLRLPENAVARAIAGAVDGLLIATSANLAGLAPAGCAREAMGYFRGEIDAVVDGGPSTCKLSSTIVDVTGEEAMILREGAVPADSIYAVVAEALKRGNS